MFEFDGEMRWKANRGTGGKIVLTPKDGETFNQEDVVKINVYEKNKLQDEPVLTKIAEINENGTKATIELTNNDMEIGNIVNKKTVYWYEIKCNGSTLIGWNEENGARTLELYPEGSED